MAGVVVCTEEAKAEDRAGFRPAWATQNTMPQTSSFPIFALPKRVGKRGDRSLGENGKLKNKTDKTKPSRTDMNNLKPAVQQRLELVKITGGLPWSCSPEQWAPLGFHSACPGLLLHGP